MNVQQLIDEARAMSQPAFAKRYAHLFFLYRQENSSPTQMAFHTEMAGDDGGAHWTTSGVISVAAVVKSPESPYGDRISIGRARNCDVVLRHPSISKLHAHLKVGSAGEWLLFDKGSQNGTTMADVRLAPETATQIRAGDVVLFGTLSVRVVDSTELYNVLGRLSALSSTKMRVQP